MSVLEHLGNILMLKLFGSCCKYT